MRIILMVGASGSGKTTWISREFPHASVCSSDDYFIGADGIYRFDARELGRAHAECLRNFIELIQSDEDIEELVVDNTNTSIAELSPYIAVSRAFGFEPEVFWMEESDVAKLTARNEHGVHAGAVRGMLRNMDRTRYDWPSFWPRPTVIRP